MIRLKGEPGQKAGCKIEFTQRSGSKGKYPPLELELLYGHRCPACNMVMDAVFYVSDNPVDITPYEETDVVNKEGVVKKIIPNPEETTAYVSDILPYAGGRQVQRLRLKNHLLRPENLGSEDCWEPGGRTCIWTGVFSLRDDLTAKDLVLASHIEDVAGYRLQGTADFIPVKELPPRIKDKPVATGTLVEVPAFGDAPPVILFTRRDAHDGWEWNMKTRLNKFKRKEE